MARSLRTSTLVAVLAAAACGDADDEASPTGSMDAGASVGPSDAGQDAASVGDAGLVCGADERICEAPEFDFGALVDAGVTMIGPIDITALTPEQIGTLVQPTPCCTAEGACGVTEPSLLGGGDCFALDQPGVQDGQCPDEALEVVSGVSIPVPGCCKPTNECGLDLNPLGVGCAERGAVIELVTAVASSLPDGGLEGALSCEHAGP